MEEVGVEALAEILSVSAQGLGPAVQLLDVREQWEFDTARLPGFTLRPLSELSEWCARAWHSLITHVRPCLSTRLRRANTLTTDFDRDKATYLLCHHGVRSRQAASFLLFAGFTKVYNVTGGIDAFTRRVDPSIPAY